MSGSEACDLRFLDGCVDSVLYVAADGDVFWVVRDKAIYFVSDTAVDWYSMAMQCVFNALTFLFCKKFM